MPEKRPVGVVLFQLGGPESIDEVEPFLYNLFCDPNIIHFPLARLGRRPLARLISATRARKVQRHYAEIGGGSPLRKLTERQAYALEESLRGMGVEARCVVAMRYWHPLTTEAIAQLDAFGCREVVLLPLYPHYSSTTTGSSLREWGRHFRGRPTPVHLIRDFYSNPRYLEAVVEKIDTALARFDHPRKAVLVFSAHGLPISVVEAGDPYQSQIAETVALVMKGGGWPNRHCLCYQSKVGGGRWLGPSLGTTLRDLAAKGAEAVCVVPISFVSDHVETLGEIDREARREAYRLGFSQFEMTAGLNDAPKFISALTEMVLNCITAQQEAALFSGGATTARVPQKDPLAAD